MMIKINFLYRVLGNIDVIDIFLNIYFFLRNLILRIISCKDIKILDYLNTVIFKMTRNIKTCANKNRFIDDFI